MHRIVRISIYLSAALSCAVPTLLGQTQESPVLLFAGDLTLSHRVEEFVEERFDYVFQHWKEIGPFDVFMVNLEHPITTSSDTVEKEFNFKLHPKYLSTLKHAGISIVNAANNHMADYGLAGLLQTMHCLDSAGITYVGIGRNLEEARKPVIVNIRGKRIGFLGYHGGGTFAAGASRPGIAPRHEPYILADVRSLRPKVDYVVVNFHWGIELATHPERRQIELAHRVVDAGADLIVGHHPHVLQGIERYRSGVIAYSLGNFVFGGNSRHTYETAILRVILDDEPRVELVPVSVVRWQPRVAQGDARLSTERLVRERSAQFQQSFFLHTGVQP